MKLISLTKRIFLSRAFFYISISFLMVCCRLLFFDYNSFFALKSIPNHDMYQGASFFATSMQSMRLTGDIAWWNPVSLNGYAQYYQSFLGPLAPTPGNIVFILWAQFVRGLSYLGFVMPEYFQYLTVTYIILPFLAFLAFVIFSASLFRYRTTILLTLIVYTFSGIGLWYSAFIYFQEPFTLFLFLAACIRFLKLPRLRTLAMFLAASLLQLASFNYWTLFNLWFIAILLGGYVLIYPQQVRRAAAAIWAMFRTRRLVMMIMLFASLGIAILWGAIIVSVALEQEGVNTRTAQFTVDDAEGLKKTVSSYTVDLFNPNITSIVAPPYDTYNTMHNADYIGAFLIPLIVLFPIHAWQRGHKWLIISAVGVLLVCLAPPLLLSVWQYVPFMNRIRHQFQFYPIYWRLFIILIAASGLEFLLRGDLTYLDRQRMKYLLAALMSILFLSLLGIQLLSPDIAIRALIPTLFMWEMIAYPKAGANSLFMLVLLTVALMDTSSFFLNVSKLDNDFTATRWQQSSRPLPDDVSTKLYRSWSDFDPNNTSTMFENMPISNDFWPSNSFMLPNYLAIVPQPDWNLPFILQAPPISFHESLIPLPVDEEGKEIVAYRPDSFAPDALLFNVQAAQMPKSPKDILQIGSGWQAFEVTPSQTEIFRWVDNDAEIKISAQSGKQKTLVLEVEPGPGLNYQPFELQLLDNTNQIVGKAQILHRQEVQFTVQTVLNTDSTFKLHIIGGGLPAPNDTRILNFRVMRLGWSSDSSPYILLPFTSHSRGRQYNSWSFDVTVPDNGWISINQIYDPLWEITIDGQRVQAMRANFVRTAFPITRGQHSIRLEYWPLARRIYWLASTLLELFLIFLVIIAVMDHQTRTKSFAVVAFRQLFNSC